MKLGNKNLINNNKLIIIIITNQIFKILKI